MGAGGTRTSRKWDSLSLTFSATCCARRPSIAQSVGDRELATVLFTDIVDSTERAASLGDAAWQAMLDRYEQSAFELIRNAGGRLVKTTGDGLLATFRGPSYAITVDLFLSVLTNGRVTGDPTAICWKNSRTAGRRMLRGRAEVPSRRRPCRNRRS